MKKVGNHKSFSKIFFSLALLLSFSLSVFSQDSTAVATPTAGGDPVTGKALFNANCAACHALDKPMTGPALRGVAQKYDIEFLYKWIRNNTELIKAGDATALKIYNENGQKAMTVFPALTNVDIDNILAYTSEPIPTVVSPTPGPDDLDKVEPSGISNNVVLGALALVLAMLIVMLF